MAKRQQEHVQEPCITPGVVVSRKPSLCVKPCRQSALKGANSFLQTTLFADDAFCRQRFLQVTLLAGSNLAFFCSSVKAAESGSLCTILERVTYPILLP